MRLILECHPDIFCFDELKGYAFLQGSAMEYPSDARLIGLKIPRWTEQLTKPVLSDDGPEGPCQRFYRGEKILFLYRDVLDTIASMFKLKWGETNWCELWVRRIIDAKLAQDEIFALRYSEEVSFARNCPKPLIAFAALYWKYKTEALFQYQQENFPVLPVAYESLVRQPASVLDAVCKHLGIPFNPILLQHEKIAHTELFDSGFTLGETDPKRPIQSASVGQWQRFLSDEDLVIIDRVVGDLPLKLAQLSTSPALSNDSREESAFLIS